MEMINKEFYIPYYIFEEIVNYIELTSKGLNKSSKWENIKTLINLAVLNNHITKSQADFLVNSYNREKK